MNDIHSNCTQECVWGPNLCSEFYMELIITAHNLVILCQLVQEKPCIVLLQTYHYGKILRIREDNSGKRTKIITHLITPIFSLRL